MSKKKKILIGVGGFFALMMVIGSFSDDTPPATTAAPVVDVSPTTTTAAPSSTTASPSPTRTTVAPKPKPAPKPVPMTAQEKVDKALRDSGVTGAKITENTGGVIFVSIPVGDNLTNGMIRSGTERDAKDVMAAIAKTKAATKGLGVRGVADMQDQYGNPMPNSQVFWVFLKGETVKKINWGNEDYMLTMHLEDVADAYNWHPAFR